MKLLKSLSLTGALAVSLALAQQPPKTMGVHTFPPDTVFENAAKNNAGDFAFVARWTEKGTKHAAIYTSQRVVATEGEMNGAVYLAVIPKDPKLTINNAGVVAYQAAFAASKDQAALNLINWAVFIESRPAFPRTIADLARPFTFTEDGKIVVQPVPGMPPAQPDCGGVKLSQAAKARLWGAIAKGTGGNVDPSSVIKQIPCQSK